MRAHAFYPPDSYCTMYPLLQDWKFIWRLVGFPRSFDIVWLYQLFHYFDFGTSVTFLRLSSMLCQCLKYTLVHCSVRLQDWHSKDSPSFSTEVKQGNSVLAGFRRGQSLELSGCRDCSSKDQVLRTVCDLDTSMNIARTNDIRLDLEGCTVCSPELPPRPRICNRYVIGICALRWLIDHKSMAMPPRRRHTFISCWWGVRRSGVR